MRRTVTIPALMAFAIVAFSVSTARSQFDHLARQLPSSSNAIVFVNLEKLMASPLAVKEKWSANRDTAFASGVSFLPPDAKQAVLAMQVDVQLWLPMWEAAILELDHEPNVDKVVQASGGSSDVIGGRQAVALPGDAYLIKFGKSTAAFMAPANRQMVARWMREIDARKGVSLSPYLSEAYSFAARGTPVILALDLEDVIPLAEIKAQLQESKEFLAEHKLDIDHVAKTLSGIRGVTLGITFNEKPFGKIKVDLRDDVTLSPEVAKAALIHALSNHGAMLDEFEDWKPGVSGKQITLEGDLTSSGMRRLSSLFDRPPSLKFPESTPEKSSNSKEQLTIQASQAYFKQITDLLEDLKDEKKGGSRYTMGQIGVWMDKYATKIDRLSVLNVDPELVEFAAAVSNSLRDAYDAIRGGAARSRVRQVNSSVSYGYDGYNYSGASYGYTYRGAQRAHYQDQSRIRAEERVTSASSARDIVGNIKAAAGEIRRKMTQKYQVDF